MHRQQLTSCLLTLGTSIFCTVGAVFPVFAGTPQEQMSQTVETLCPQLAGINKADPNALTKSEKDVLFRCGELKRQAGQSFEQLSSEQKNGLSNMTSDESSVMGTATVELSGVQSVAVLGRLAYLRGKAVSGVASLTPVPGNGDNRKTQVYAGTSTGVSSEAGQNVVETGELFSGYDGGFSQSVDYGRWGFFFTGSYGTGEKDETAREQGFDFDAWSLVSGVDYRFSESFVLGGAIGYAMTSSSIDRDAGDVDLDGFGLSLYGTYYVGEFYFDFLAGFAFKDFDTSRNVVYSVPAKAGGTTQVNQSFSGATDAVDVDLSLGGGYNLAFGAFGLTPYARATYLRSDIDGYTESLGNTNTNPGFGLALEVDDQEIESLATTVGLHLSSTVNTAKGVFTPYLRLDWEHEFMNDARTITARFATVRSDFDSLNRILIPTDDPDRDYFNLGAGASFLMPGGYLFFLDYATVLDYDNLVVHNLALGIRIEF